MRRARGARAFGALWCAGIAFSYYGAQIFFASLAEQGWLSAAAARWKVPVSECRATLNTRYCGPL